MLYKKKILGGPKLGYDNCISLEYLQYKVL
jgi:hypothetical protein